MADINVTSTSTDSVDVVGLDNIKADLKLELPQPFQTESVNTYEIKPLKADFGTDSHVAIDPLKADVGTDSHIAIAPLKTDNSVSVDLKPVVVDLCLTLNSGKTPNLCIRQPYRHKIGFTLYGVEVWGFSFTGEQETVVNELSARPQTAPSEEARWPPTRAADAQSKPASGATSGAGLRIRLEP